MARLCETGVVTSPGPIIAAFDLDGTLSDGGSVFPWLTFLCGRRSTYLAALRLAGPPLVGAVRSGPGRSGKRATLSSPADRSRRRAGAWVFENFAIADFEEHGREWVIERLNWHLRQGHDVVIVSASPELYAGWSRDVERRRRPRHCLAVDARGKLSGSYLGRNCRGREKLRRLGEWLQTRYPETAPMLYAYGNSRGDRRMSRGATFPYDVGRLGAFGALRHFPRLRHASTEAIATADE